MDVAGRTEDSGNKTRQRNEAFRMAATTNEKILQRFGFNFARGGAHSSRTIMLEELTTLISHVNRSDATKEDYLRAIENENCLGKRSGKTRTLTYRHLVDLYTLDPTVTVFRTLLYFWQRDVSARPLLALLCAFCRDSILRSTAEFILKSPEGSTVSRDSIEQLIEDRYPERFSTATLKSTAQNTNSTWTKSGHLSGRVRKFRSNAKASAGSVSYALLLGYLTGARGGSLFISEYARLLDCSVARAMELAEEASRKGWIDFKRIGDVIEVLFPNLLNSQEMEWVSEQS
jgi:hypothetical protein